MAASSKAFMAELARPHGKIVEPGTHDRCSKLITHFSCCPGLRQSTFQNEEDSEWRNGLSFIQIAMPVQTLSAPEVLQLRLAIFYSRFQTRSEGSAPERAAPQKACATLSLPCGGGILGSENVGSECGWRERTAAMKRAGLVMGLPHAPRTAQDALREVDANPWDRMHLENGVLFPRGICL